METVLRDEIFSLCKKIQTNDVSINIKNLIHNLSTSSENKNTGEIRKILHENFAYVARELGNQFYGYLYVDDNADTMQLPFSMKIEHLYENERVLLERGHATLLRFINLCLTEIHCKSKVVAEAINPYSLLKEINLNESSSSFFSDEDYAGAVRAFKNGTVYKALIDSDFLQFFENLGITQVQGLIFSTIKDLDKSLSGDISPDLKRLAFRFIGHNIDFPDAVWAFSLLVVALKKSLIMSCQLMFSAMCGCNLSVLNNDNIIKLNNKISNQVYEYYDTIIQGALIDPIGNIIGNIVLFDCEITENWHAHDFGMVYASTINFSEDFGHTTKLLFITIDKEMNPIHQITRTIIQHGLPRIKKLKQD